MWSTDMDFTITSGATAKPIRFRLGLSPASKRSGGFCCQVPPNPACRSLSRQDFKCRYYKPLTRPALPEHSCRWQLWIGPSRRYHTGQKHVLYALVDPVSAPPKLTSRLSLGGAAGYCPRVRKVYC